MIHIISTNSIEEEKIIKHISEAGVNIPDYKISKGEYRFPENSIPKAVICVTDGRGFQIPLSNFTYYRRETCKQYVKENIPVFLLYKSSMGWRLYTTEHHDDYIKGIASTSIYATQFLNDLNKQMEVSLGEFQPCALNEAIIETEPDKRLLLMI